MPKKNNDEFFSVRQQYIDKTKVLEKGIVVFPSIYIEGAAGLGKSCAVRMLLEKHPEVTSLILDAGYDLKDLEQGLDKDADKDTAKNANKVAARFADIRAQMQEKPFWLVIENINEALPENIEQLLVDFVLRMPEQGRVIFVGRERPGKPFLRLFWEKKMEMIAKETLLFSEDEVREYCEEMKASLSPTELFQQTGGWAGCVDSMLRVAAYYEKYTGEILSPTELRKTYEIDGYIKQEILGTLSGEETEMMRRSQECPWLDENICREVWNISNPREVLESLGRKGIFYYDRKKDRWSMLPLFRCETLDAPDDASDDVLAGDEQRDELTDWVNLAQWYEQNYFIKEALYCLEKSGDKKAYRQCVIRNYTEIPYLKIEKEEILEWKETAPGLSYLKGIYLYAKADFKGLDREIAHLEKQECADSFLKQEVLLNLYYLKPDFSLDDWLSMLKKSDGENFHIYNMLGSSFTYLCGLRDLTGLFACTKKEENQKAKLWKTKLGEAEWNCYQLARLDYYLETERQNVLRKEDYELIMDEQENRESSLASLYLLCKMQRLSTGEETELEERIQEIGSKLQNSGNAIARKNAEAIFNLFSPWMGNSEKLARWLKEAEPDTKEPVTEKNCFRLSCIAKGYILMNQYKKAQRLLRRLIPYMRDFRRKKILTELIFQQSMTNWELESHGQALQNVIESFLINGDSRYVDCYASYGKKGQEVLEAYAEWMRSNEPEGWHRKKKYQYGNVLRMPIEDYIEVILRCTRREARASRIFEKETSGERLTMMETIILQNIGRGLSNNEICEELNLKLPTVKTHIYSIYKKLGANSRVQAVLRGKEIGILN